MSAASIIEAAGFAARPKAVSVKDVSAAEFIAAFAKHLESSDSFLPLKKDASKTKDGKVISKLPAWTEYVKTGTGREPDPIGKALERVGQKALQECRTKNQKQQPSL